MLPLAGPVSIPAGILGSPSLGTDGLRAMLRDLMNNDSGMNEWISHPRVGEWLATAAAFPEVMAVEVVGRSAIAQSLCLLPSEPFPSEVYFANQLVKDLWRGMELRVLVLRRQHHRSRENRCTRTQVLPVPVKRSGWDVRRAECSG
jgi:hypothetical protein